MIVVDNANCPASMKTTININNNSIQHNRLTTFLPSTRFLWAGNLFRGNRHVWQNHMARHFESNTLAGLERFRHERISRDTRRHGAGFRRHLDGHHERHFEFQRHHCAIHRDRRDGHEDRSDRVVGRVPDCLRRLRSDQPHLLLVRHVADPELGSFAGQGGGQRLRLRQQLFERQFEEEKHVPAAGHAERSALERQLKASRSAGRTVAR